MKSSKPEILEEAYSFKNLHSMINEILALIQSHEQLNARTGKFNIIENELKLTAISSFTESSLDINNYFQQIINYSLNVRHPRCSGYQLSIPLPVTVAVSVLSSYLNNGMATYDSGPFATVAEKKVIDFFLDKFQLGDLGGGFMTSGGTLGNLSSLLYAREYLRKKNSNDLRADHTKVIFSGHCHYSIRKALYTMGIEERNFIEIGIDSNFRMDINRLNDAISECAINGFEIMAVIATAGSSSLGVYDNLEEIGKLCASRDIWLHVDAAHGGAAIFSSKYKHLMSGAEYANSIVIDAHKLLMCPALSSVVLIRNFRDSNPYRQSCAPYLWRNEEEAQSDLSRNTYECTKTMMSIGLYAVISMFGDKIFEDYLNRIFDLANNFYALLKNDEHFDVPIKPMCNIVCFTLRYKQKDIDESNYLNKQIYQAINQSGEFFIAKTEIDNKFYFRISIMNPFTKLEDLIALIERIRGLANMDTEYHWHRNQDAVIP